METVYLMRQMMEYYRARKRDLHMVIIHLKKPDDKVPREVLWWTMTKKGIPKKYINTVQDMYQ